MNASEIKAIVLRALCDVAPDVEPATIDPAMAFTDQFDFDSMDRLNFAIGLHKALGIDIPEKDYPRLTSLDDCVAYLETRQGD